jgi:hypothetical protein
MPGVAVPLIAASKHSEWLPQATAFTHEFVRRRGIEFEHFVVARNDQLGANIVGQLRGLGSGQIPGYASFRSTAIDRE